MSRDVSEDFKSLIEDIVVIGDSLSDRGGMAERELFEVIPMELVSGLSRISLTHRFTNGMVWTDYVAANFAAESGFSSVNLNDPMRVTTDTGETVMRTFCEGGITSHNYVGRPTLNVGNGAKQQILNNLDVLRERLFNDDDLIGTTQKIKAKTLVVEWSGANDLLTINSEPTVKAAEDAVTARINNVKEMIKKGYRHFALLTLPDLSLVPRYQAKSEHDQQIIRTVVKGFNERLIEEVKKLENAHSNCTFMVHDTNPLFKDAFNNPGKYGLDKAKRSVPFTESEGFRLGGDAGGFMFNDDVHPTTRVHQELAKDFQFAVKAKYLLHAPHESLMQIYREQYGARWEKDRSKCCGFFYKSNIEHTRDALTVEEVLRHALVEKGGRTRDVLIKLGWIDSKNRLSSKNPHIVSAFSRVQEQIVAAAAAMPASRFAFA